MKKITILIIVIVLLSSCTAYKQINAIKNLQYNFEGINVGMPSLGKIVLLVDIGIYNPNNIDVKIEEINYEIFIDDKKIAVGETEEDIVIKKNAKTTYSTKVKPELSELKENLPNIMMGLGNMKILVKGDVTFNTSVGAHTFPFSIERKMGEE